MQKMDPPTVKHTEMGTLGMSEIDAGRDLPNYYDVLNVDPMASRLDIREAYLKLKDTYSAGSVALYSLVGEDEAKDSLAGIEAAFRVLNDGVKRREFDQRMGIGPVAAIKYSDKNAATYMDETARQTERLNFLRARQEIEGPAWDHETRPEAHRDHDPTVVRTTRSLLTVINLKATRVDTPEMLDTYAALINESDPSDGDLFRKLREAADVSQNEMQERTKVSIGYIKAIEINHFERLPQAVFVKGFLRSYFRYLMVPDADRLVVAFAARLEDWQSSSKS